MTNPEPAYGDFRSSEDQRFEVFDGNAWIDLGPANTPMHLIAVTLETRLIALEADMMGLIERMRDWSGGF